MTDTLTFAVFLPCGCPCSFVMAGSTARAAEILFNRDKQAGTRLRIEQVGLDRHRKVVEELRAARGRRFECRGRHGVMA